MIVTGGLGRSSRGASGIIAAFGLGIVVITGGSVGGEGVTLPRYAAVQAPTGTLVRVFDDIDLLEIIPIIVEVINARR